jgi:hypothetical protein
MNPRMDAAGPVDAKTASTGPWKTAPTAVSHSAHTPSRFHGEHEIDRPAHEISDTPRPEAGARPLASVSVSSVRSVAVTVSVSSVALCWNSSVDPSCAARSFVSVGDSLEVEERVQRETALRWRG